MKATVFVPETFGTGKWQTVQAKELPKLTHPILQPIIAKIGKSYMVFDAKTGAPLSGAFSNSGKDGAIGRVKRMMETYIKTQDDLDKSLQNLSISFPAFNHLSNNPETPQAK